MKRIISFALPVMVVIALFWSNAQRHAPEASTMGFENSATSASRRGGPDDPVVIRIGKDAITRSDFQRAMESIPENSRASFENPAGKKSVAEELIRLYLLDREATRLGVDRQPDVQNALEMNRRQILASAALRALVDRKQGSDLRAIYDKNRDQFTVADARQIVVAYQGGRVRPRDGKALSRDEAIAKAREIVKRLRAGADFAQVARAESDDATAAQGGRIGKVTQGDLPPEIAKALFALKVGEVSDPVVSPLGVHIFEVTDRQVRPFEQVEGVLRAQGGRLLAQQVMDDLRKKAKVEFDPKFFGGAKTPEK